MSNKLWHYNKKSKLNDVIEQVLNGTVARGWIHPHNKDNTPATGVLEESEKGEQAVLLPDRGGGDGDIYSGGGEQVRL